MSLAEGFLKTGKLSGFACLQKHVIAGCGLIFGLLISAASIAEDQPHIAYDADLYLVPIGPVPRETLESFAAHFRGLINFKVEITAPLPLPDRTVDRQRKQLIAEQVNDVMARIFGPTLQKSSALVIGITANDMYIAAMNWRFAYSHGNGQYAVVSAARMGDGISNNERWSTQVMLRMQKMLDKRVAIQSLGMGARIPAPPVLNKPILSLEDLDQLDAQALHQALAAAALLFTPQYAKPVPFEVVEADADMAGWLIALIVAACIAILAWILWIAKKQSRAMLAEWKAFALERGWRYTEGESKLYTPPFSIEGQIDEIPFALIWYREGSGKSARYKTQFAADFASSYTLNITPNSSVFSALFARHRTKTGDPLYDCRFILRQEGEPLHLSQALRNKHVTLPTAVHINNEHVQLIHDGHLNQTQVDSFLDLAKAWLGALLNSTPQADIASQDDLPRSAFQCLLTRFYELAFWVFLLTSVAMLFWFPSEETNLPWIVSWNFLWPVASVIYIAWVVTRWNQRKLQERFISDTVIGAFALLFVWGLSGAWALAWNAKVGPQLDVLVVGAVTHKNASSGKGGPSYSMSLFDIESQRDVKISVNHATYESLRLGDPVAFDLKKGSLGIYYFTR